MPEYTPARLRRLCAIVIDLQMVGCVLIFLAFGAFLLPKFAGICVPFFLTFLYLVYWYGRDWLLGGRSIGKRLCGLSVVDAYTLGPATGAQLLRKGLAIMVLPFDGFMLLLTGRSIGERISGTAVVTGAISSPLSKKRIVKVLALALVFSLVLGGIATVGLNHAKENESYALARDYLSEKGFPDDMDLTGYSSTTVNGEHTHTYNFRDLRIVVCHQSSDGTWSVCESCSELE